ncbi:MAG: energy-coupling factor transporter ATPase [Clostridiales bacterium]|nr:energy-coupling factor transporter ATPase [Clostridiales bacterium]
MSEIIKDVLRTENLTHTYSVGTPFEKVAVDDISFSVDSDDFIGIIGHTGSGKSTFIRHLNGLEKPTSGKVLFCGEDIWEKNFSRRNLRFKVGMVFQYPEYQLFEQTVRADIAFGPKNMKLSAEEIEERVEAAMDFVGLDKSLLNESPFELSGGQKRRVAIAGIMAMKPDILVLDEPTAGLDPRGRDEILDRIREYHLTQKKAVLLVSHNMEDVANNANKILVLDHGKIDMFGPTDEIFSKADRLCEIGLDIPQITRIFLNMKNRGYDVDSTVYSVKKACDEIVSLYEKQKR